MNIEQIIYNLLAPQSEIIKLSTVQLRAALHHPETVLKLCQIVMSQKEVPLRHYAAVILRKHLGKEECWRQVAIDQQALIKQGMLNTLINEQGQSLRTAIAQLVGRIIRHEEGHMDPWTEEVMQFVYTYCRSANASESERGSSVFATLADVNGDQFMQRLDNICEMCTEALLSADRNGTHASPTMFNILIGMGHLVPFIPYQKVAEQTYQNSLPLVVKCLWSLAADQPERFCSAFELLENMAECTPNLLSVHVKLLLQFCMEICINEPLDKIVRVKSVWFISSLIRYHKKSAVNQQMIAPIVSILFNVLTTATATEDDDDEDYFGGADGSNIMGAAAQTLNTLALNISPEKLITPLTALMETALQGQNPLAHRAAYLSMAIMAEGCAETICSKYLETMLNTIKTGLSDQVPLVRSAAFYALGQFSEYLQPEISNCASLIMPILFDFLGELCKELRTGGTAPRHIKHLFYALETFCENLGACGLVPHLPILMQRLFEAAAPTNSVQVRELALNSIVAAVNTAKQHMLPFFGHLISLLQGCLVDTDQPDIVSLRAPAVNTLAAVARHVGQQPFLPLANDTMNYALKLLNGTDDTDIRAAVYNLLGGLTHVLHEEVAPILPQVLERIYSSVVISEISLHEGEGSDTDTDESDDDLAVENAYLREKEQSVYTLQEFATNTGSAFLPHAQAAFDHVFKVIDNNDEDVRKAAIGALTKLVLVMFKHDGKAAENAIQKLISKMSNVVHHDEDTELVRVALENVAELVRELKEAALIGAGVIQEMFRCINDVMTNKTVCQFNEQQESDAEISEIGGAIVEAAADILPALGFVLEKAEFDTQFKRIYRVVLKKCESFKMHDHLKPQRAGIYWDLAECFKSLPGLCCKYFDEFLPIFCDAIKEDFNKIRCNAIYALGQLVANSGPKSYNSYPHILSVLSSCVSVEADPSCKDYICGALARIIMNNYLLISLNQVMPVFMELLPLREDFDEYGVIFRCLTWLYAKTPEVLGNHCDRTMAVTIEALLKNKFPDNDAKEEAIHLLMHILAAYPNQFNAFKLKYPEVCVFLDELLD